MSMKPSIALFIPLCSALTAEPPVPSFTAIDVATKVEIGYGLAVADVNGDGKPNILLADKNLIVWYENPTWTKHIMAEKLITLDHVCIAAQDIDGDGKCEVAVGAGWNPIHDNTMACEDLCLADLAGDGKLDIVAAGRAKKNVKVYMN